MERRVLLLRGINVGRNNRIRMPDLVALLERAGCADVRTHLQSGNALVSSDLDEAGLTALAEQALADAGLAVRVLARTGPELDAVLAADPFADRAVQDKLLHVAFLEAAPPEDRVAALLEAVQAPEEVVVRGREAWVLYANGVQGTRLTPALGRLGVAMTARNRRTCVALRDLLLEA